MMHPWTHETERCCQPLCHGENNNKVLADTPNWMHQSISEGIANNIPEKATAFVHQSKILVLKFILVEKSSLAPRQCHTTRQNSEKVLKSFPLCSIPTEKPCTCQSCIPSLPFGGEERADREDRQLHLQTNEHWGVNETENQTDGQDRKKTDRQEDTQTQTDTLVHRHRHTQTHTDTQTYTYTYTQDSQTERKYSSWTSPLTLICTVSGALL